VSENLLFDERSFITSQYITLCLSLQLQNTKLLNHQAIEQCNLFCSNVKGIYILDLHIQIKKFLSYVGCSIVFVIYFFLQMILYFYLCKYNILFLLNQRHYCDKNNLKVSLIAKKKEKMYLFFA